MSLKSKITGTKETDRAFKKILLTLEPDKENFYTLSGKKAFSDEYRLRFPNVLTDFRDSSLVGTAFDYMARFRIAKFIKRPDMVSSLVAYNGIYKLRKLPGIQSYYSDKYKPWEKKIEEVVISQKPISQLYEIAVHLAKLEQIARAGVKVDDVNLVYIFNEPAKEEVLRDLEQLLAVFEETFMIPKIISKKSRVDSNPSFGIGSLLVDGADGDIFIDGTLYDFKTTKVGGLQRNDILQMIGYYILNALAVYTCSEELDFGYSDKTIKRIAFYKARFGEVECYDVEKYLPIDMLKKKLIELAEHFKGNEGSLNKYIGYGDVIGAKRNLEKIRNGIFPF